MPIFNCVYWWPVHKREPWVNTLAYYPLEVDVNDYSWNWRNWTNSNVTFSDWVAVFNWTNSEVTFSNASWQRPTTNFTISVWARALSWDHNTYNRNYYIVSKKYEGMQYYRQSIYEISLSYNNKTFVWGINNWDSRSVTPWNTNVAISLNDWHLYTITNDNQTKSVYLDGSLLSQGTTWTISDYSSEPPLRIWNSTPNPSWSYATNGWFNWNISNVILESKTRTAQEISDYYNSTKSNYGL